jgi:D-alanine transaminase
MKISYVNGSYVPHENAVISVDDRGTDFADGVYEVVSYKNGQFIDLEPHLKRLDNSLKALRMEAPLGSNELKKEIFTVVEKNNIPDGIVYIRITRGVALRDHPFPADTKTSLVITVKPWKKPSDDEYKNGVPVITHPEIRWAWRHIKSISLLPNVIAKQAAVEKNCKEAWFVEKDGTVTEASSSNVYIVKNNVVITHPANESILGGITRDTLISLARKNGIKVEERPFTIDEAFAADEAFMSSTSMNAIPVNQIDDVKIPVGKIAKQLHELYEEYISKVAKQAA